MSSSVKRINLPKVALIIYVLVMAWLLFGQRMDEPTVGSYWENIRSSINFTPFQTIEYFYRSLMHSTDDYLVKRSAVNLIGNVVMFIPLGFLLPWVFPKLRSYLKSSAFSALCIVMIEFVQLFTLLGGCDIDDFILNMIGALVGRLLFALKSD